MSLRNICPYRTTKIYNKFHQEMLINYKNIKIMRFFGQEKV
jgi:ATP-dependent RNA circularization protein (DNA/RNA ligase family)